MTPEEVSHANRRLLPHWSIGGLHGRGPNQHAHAYEDTTPEGNSTRKQANLEAGVISLQVHDPTTNPDSKEFRAAELPGP